jgi:hypothetical protein
MIAKLPGSAPPDADQAESLRYRFPTMDTDSAAGILDVTDDDIYQLVDRGFFWVWNVAVPRAKRHMIRLLTLSVCGIQDQVNAILKDKYILGTRVPGTKEEAVAAVLTSIPGERPYILSSEITRALNFRGNHMNDLMVAKALPEMPGTHRRRGPNGNAKIPREAFEQFLRDRLLC